MNNVTRTGLVCAAALLSLSLSREIAVNGRMSGFPGGSATGQLLLWMATSSALWALLSASLSFRSRLVAGLPLLVFTIRFLIPLLSGNCRIPSNERPIPREVLRAQELLRLISASQEEYRLQSGEYTADVNELKGFKISTNEKFILKLSSEGNRGWSGSIQYNQGICEIQVGYIAVNAEITGAVEGVPNCSETMKKRPNQRVHGTRFRGQPEPDSSRPLVLGDWPQHRADSRRTGIVGFMGPARRWDTWVSGELRASASVAGSQVFVGAHGNGELASLDLRTGVLMWRMRAPNWIHHEPVVKGELLAYGFGNNEGTPPNGFDVRDRRTGRLLWRQLVQSPAMGAPIIHHGLVVGAEASGRIHAWSQSTGQHVWTSEIWSSKSYTVSPMPMMNPLLKDDSTLAVSFEKTGWCLFKVSSGQRFACSSSGTIGWGSGHSSPTRADSLILLSGNSNYRIPVWAKILGISPDHVKQKENKISVLAFDGVSGRKVWETKLSGQTSAVYGHIAGTPVVEGRQAYIALPTIGEVVSLVASTGRVRWRAKTLPARGSVTVVAGRVFVATSNSTWVILDAMNGQKVCENRLPGNVDRAGLTVAGSTGVLTFSGGLVSAAPVSDWLACSVRWVETTTTLRNRVSVTPSIRKPAFSIYAPRYVSAVTGISPTRTLTPRPVPRP
jgi:outer membrane protein assembly factor BamB